MSELERMLAAAAHELEWPPTPAFHVPAATPRSRRRPILVLAASALAALAVAFAVPGARSAILHAFHLEGVRIERVGVLPPAQERPLAAGLGLRISRVYAARVLGRPFLLPALTGAPALHVQGGAVSVLLADPAPVLLSEFRTEAGAAILHKLVGSSTGVTGLKVGGAPGFWISGEEHVYLAPSAPPRLAGHVLIWASAGIVFRLEGRDLSEKDALRLAGELKGT